MQIVQIVADRFAVTSDRTRDRSGDRRACRVEDWRRRRRSRANALVASVRRVAESASSRARRAWWTTARSGSRSDSKRGNADAWPSVQKRCARARVRSDGWDGSPRCTNLRRAVVVPSGPQTPSIAGSRIAPICTIDRRADAVRRRSLCCTGRLSPAHRLDMGAAGVRPNDGGVLRAARVARLKGFVPIGVPILNRIDGALVKNCHLCLISDEDSEMRWRPGRTKWPYELLSVALASPRVHVLLRIGRDELTGVHGVGTRRIPADVLVGAVRPVGTATDASRAGQARGGRVAGTAGSIRRSSLARWRPPRIDRAARIAVRVFSRVAEQPLCTARGRR